MILPTFCLTYGSLAFLSRFVRGSTLEIIRKDYIRTALAKGLAEKDVIYKHIFKNTMILYIIQKTMETLPQHIIKEQKQKE